MGQFIDRANREFATVIKHINNDPDLTDDNRQADVKLMKELENDTLKLLTLIEDSKYHNIVSTYFLKILTNTPITDIRIDDDWIEITLNKFRSARCNNIEKIIDDDGDIKYFNTRMYVFMPYMGGPEFFDSRSCEEIELPYYLNDPIKVVIEEDDFNDDDEIIND